jgi:hypothetical protein
MAVGTIISCVGTGGIAVSEAVVEGSTCGVSDGGGVMLGGIVVLVGTAVSVGAVVLVGITTVFAGAIVFVGTVVITGAGALVGMFAGSVGTDVSVTLLVSVGRGVSVGANAHRIGVPRVGRGGVFWPLFSTAKLHPASRISRTVKKPYFFRAIHAPSNQYDTTRRIIAYNLPLADSPCRMGVLCLDRLYVPDHLLSVMP